MSKKDGSQSQDGFCNFCGDRRCDHECHQAEIARLKSERDKYVDLYTEECSHKWKYTVEAVKSETERMETLWKLISADRVNDERERCAKIVNSLHGKFGIKTVKAILTPAASGEGVNDE